MKRLIFRWWLVAGWLGLGSVSAMAAGPRDAAWKEVDDAIRQGQPRTAVDRLKPIADAALRDQAWAEAAKAIARSIALETQIEGRQPEERITRMTEALKTAPAPLQPIFQSLLAHAYWGYFQNNRWRFNQRTAGQASGDDFRTWDLRRLFAEIDRHFTLSLAASDSLQRTPIAQFDDLLERGNVPDRLRPTLFDFLAHEAISFYAAGEQAGARPEDAFTPEAGGPILGNSAEFLAWQPSTTDTNAVAVRAIGLYQSLLRFHQADPDRSAFLHVDLERIRYAVNVATGSEKEERHIAALRAFIERADGHELAAFAHHDWARVLQRQAKLAEAHRVASEGAKRHAGSAGATWCEAVVGEIEMPTVQLQTDRVWSHPRPEIQVRYRNLDHIWFRLVAVEWDDFLDRRKPRPENLTPEQRREYLQRPATLAWDADLPRPVEFREWRADLPAPETLAPGFYLLFTSHRADFAEENNALQSLPIWVSDLALVVRPRAGRLEGFVLRAESGEAVAGAVVRAWYLANNGERVALAPQTTDEQGTFAFQERRADRGYLVEARKDNQRVAMDQDTFWPRPPNPSSRWQQVYLFTDRAIYRPGQLIQYKGIAIRQDRANDKYELLAGREYGVTFRDANGKEIARARHRANDFGSFSGSFTAPRDRLPGHMSIVVESEPASVVRFSVEEYKRPKFHVALDAPKEAARLNDRVHVEGRALAYTGSAVDGAQVRWRVTRIVQFPPWWGWFRFGRFPETSAQEIAHGTAETRSDGSFALDFKALPDPTIAESDEPSFHYIVHADVTDTAGETRSNERTVRVGFAALRAELSASDWQARDKAVELRVATRTLDDEPQAAEGTIRVHRIARPAKGPRSGPSEDLDRGNADDPNTWPLGDSVAEQSFRTDAKGTVTNRFELAPGLYRAVLETKDRFGKTATAKLGLRVLDPAAPRLGLDLPSLLAAPAWELEPGAEFEGLWGTGFESGRAFVEFEHRDRLVQRFWTAPGQTQQRLRLAVTEAMRGGFTLHVTFVRNGRSYHQSREIGVPWSNKQLELSWETFRSKLEPGAKETWTAVVKPRNRADTVAVTELVATLYDASLDQFQPHRWIQSFGFWPVYPSSAMPYFANDRRSFFWLAGSWPPRTDPLPQSYRHFPPDIAGHWPGGGWMMRPRLMARGGVAMPEMAMAADSAAVATLAAAPAPASGPGEALSFSLTKGAPARGRIMGLADGANGRVGGGGGGEGLVEGVSSALDPSTVTARQNLQETAFFLPQLTSDSNGVVRLTFTLPEALTEWRFLGFAHDRQLRSGALSGSTVTAKDLMVQPNPPRFLREGDEIEFTVKVSNRSEQPSTGRVRLELAFAHDESAADAALGNQQPEQAFSVPAKESRSYAWRLRVPDGCGFLRYKAVATTSRLSDGEEGYLPVLSRRVFLTESLPLPIRGPGTNRFSFTALAESSRSRSLRHEGVTVQMVSQPAWYAVLALPYLMEYPHECSEQIFNRYYANTLARHIATSDPKIKRVFDQWRATPALDSPLEKNADLKAVALEETPWLREATRESEARRQIAVLFEEARLESELRQALAKLAERQLPDGGWSWFPGGPHDDFITLYIVAGFGRLRSLGAKIDVQPAVRAIARLDGWMSERYEELRRKNRLEQRNIDATVALYLYTRALFAEDKPIDQPRVGAFDYWVGQAREHWLKLGRQSQAHIALAFHRLGARLSPESAKLPGAIMESLLQHSVHHEELGRFWRDEEVSWSWHRAPIETQALMIEAFSTITRNTNAVDECQVWLLKQKQTQAWKSTKATADAVFALLLGGRNLLSSDALVEVELGGRSVTPQGTKPRAESPVGGAQATVPGAQSPVPGAQSPVLSAPSSVLGAPSSAGGAQASVGGGPSGRSGPRGAEVGPEPGTGFYQVRIPAAEITAKLADIVVKKTDRGVSWGSVHWQYFEDLANVKPFAGTPLKLTKSLFVRDNTKSGRSLRPAGTSIRVGDELVVRIELRTDRDMEYVHLQDQRGSGTEPVNVMSGYRFQDGLGYYEATRDTASHFFIGYLPKGTYVFEYPVRVQHRGSYTSGVASVQCLYAPEFNSHSQALPMQVR